MNQHRASAFIAGAIQGPHFELEVQLSSRADRAFVPLD
jgi:hypothetical protein